MERRNFIKSGMAGMAALAMASTPIEALAAKSTEKRSANSTIKKPVPEEEFHLGIAGYSFVKFDLETTLKTMQTLDLHYLCIKDFHLPLTSNEEQIAAFHQKLASYGVKGYAVGPIYMKSKEEVDRAFAYAQRVGVPLLVGVPNYDLLDYTEQVVKQYDIKLAIHLHGPDMKLYPDATDIWEHVKNRDERMSRHRAQPALRVRYAGRLYQVPQACLRYAPQGCDGSHQGWQARGTGQGHH